MAFRITYIVNNKSNQFFTIFLGENGAVPVVVFHFAWQSKDPSKDIETIYLFTIIDAIDDLHELEDRNEPLQSS